MKTPLFGIFFNSYNNLDFNLHIMIKNVFLGSALGNLGSLFWRAQPFIPVLIVWLHFKVKKYIVVNEETPFSALYC
jgi:hypothetical protein